MSNNVFLLEGRWMDARWLLCVNGGPVCLARSDAPDGKVDGDADPRFAPHEQNGPLPRAIQTMVNRVAAGLPALPPRCGRPTRRDGHPPCRRAPKRLLPVDAQGCRICTPTGK